MVQNSVELGGNEVKHCLFFLSFPLDDPLAFVGNWPRVHLCRRRRSERGTGGALTTTNENNCRVTCQMASAKDEALHTRPLSLTKTRSVREGKWLAQGHGHVDGQGAGPTPTQRPCYQAQAGLCDLRSPHNGLAHLTAMLGPHPQAGQLGFLISTSPPPMGTINNTTLPPPSGTPTGQTQGLAPIPGPIPLHILKMTPPSCE